MEPNRPEDFNHDIKMKSEEIKTICHDARILEVSQIKHNYSGILFISDSGEEFAICNRDSGFEFNYQGIWYEAKNGAIRTLKTRSK